MNKEVREYVHNAVKELKAENEKLRDCIIEAISMGENYEYTEYGRKLECITILEKTLKELEGSDE